MNPIIIGVFVAVAAVVGLLAFVFRDSGASKTSTRLDVLVGKRRHDSSPDLLLKKNPFEGDQKRVLELIAAWIPNLQKFFEQADAHIKPSSLVLMGAVFGLIGVTGSWLAGVPAFFMPLPGLVLFLAPFGWLWNKRRVRLKTFGSQLPDAM